MCNLAIILCSLQRLRELKFLLKTPIEGFRHGNYRVQNLFQGWAPLGN